MPQAVTYPGVYVEEAPSQVRTIVGVPTAITAFVGFAERGPVDEPVRIQSWADYERRFGGLWAGSSMSYAVQQYFVNGGADAIVVRVVSGAAGRAVRQLGTTGDGNRLALEAANEGNWGERLVVRVDHVTRDVRPGEEAAKLFNLTVLDEVSGLREEFRNLYSEGGNPADAGPVLEERSQLVRVQRTAGGEYRRGPDRPPSNADVAPGDDPFESPGTDSAAASTRFEDSAADLDGAPAEADLEGSEAQKNGYHALLDADIFNLLCIPPVDRDGTLESDRVGRAAAFCQRNRAVLIVDPPADWDEVADARDNIDDYAMREGTNAACYFPRIRMADQLLDGRSEVFPPCGAVAGVIARTDAERGVWKAPAGQDATLAGVLEPSVPLTDGENGQLNPLGINCLRSFEGYGNVVWGSRTLRGADRLASQWKYLPVRRLALHIEESLFRGTRWAVFEPNDEPLWAQLRLNVGSFMHDLFRQGAFQGMSSREAYRVKCDSETTTQSDRDRGIVNVRVEFAPLKPAEFVVLIISQIAGQREV